LSFFSTLDAEVQALFLQHVHEEVLPVGHVVFEQGAAGEMLYVVKSGYLQVTQHLGPDVEYVLGQMGPGEIFGEMSVLEERPRSARVVASTPVELLGMSRQTFDCLIEQHPAVVVQLLKTIGARLRQRNEQQEALLAEKLLLVEELAAKNVELERTLAQLQKAMETVAEHERVTHDLEIARQIQRQMLPAAFPQVPGLELAAATVPSQWVGGDFYDAVCLDAYRVCLLLGDVSGKGIPAAMQMARLMGEFRACVSQRSDPVSVMQALNESVYARNVDWTSFVTVQYVVLDLEAQQMQYICAGHPPLFLCHTDGRVDWLGKEPNLPLGVDAAFGYQQEECELTAGDRLLLYSDGAYEVQNAAGDMFGLSRLAVLFSQTSPLPNVTIRTLQDALAAFADQPQNAYDDTTFVCARMA
jgi:serine phosphatase RsbU (regulator of sigma subunit)